MDWAVAGNYDEYFGMATDIEAVVYLMLMNQMLHDLFPTCITIGEDVSGMPTFARSALPSSPPPPPESQSGANQCPTSFELFSTSIIFGKDTAAMSTFATALSPFPTMFSPWLPNWGPANLGNSRALPHLCHERKEHGWHAQLPPPPPRRLPFLTLAVMVGPSKAGGCKSTSPPPLPCMKSLQLVCPP